MTCNHHTYMTSLQWSPLHNQPSKNVDLFMPLYNRMTAQVPSFFYPCGLYDGHSHSNWYQNEEYRYFYHINIIKFE